MKTQTVLQLICIFCTSMCFKGSQCRSFVVTTPVPDVNLGSGNDDTTIVPNISSPPPRIVDVNIRSDIQFRYAKTIVRTYIKNPAIYNSQEVVFNMVLPNKAFISNFTIQVTGNDDVYVAKVSKKQEATERYNEAVQDGQSAGIVDTDVNDANKITVKSNLEAASKMLFTLTYEELLERRNSKYEHIIHVNPGQIVKNFIVNVYINESLPITNINVPELKTDSNEITSELRDNSIAKIKSNVDGFSHRAHVQFQPTPADQRRMAKSFKQEENGMAGQFIVGYDVNRQNQGNEIQVLDGYFVHYFAPDQLEVMPRHVVFVLDVSGSMQGEKLKQTKDAVVTILNELSARDYFNILTFSDNVHHWNPRRALSNPTENSNVIPPALTHQGTPDIRKEALKYVVDLNTLGSTNINDGMSEALNVVENVRISESIPYNVKPMIIFLTDGEATTGVTDNEMIRQNVINKNTNLKVPIYGLAFGDRADFDLIKDISIENDAFARRIYESSDAALQLEDFFKEVTSINNNQLLSNVTFEYVGQSFKNKTSKTSNAFYKGGEFIVAGKLENLVGDDALEIVVRGTGKSSEYKTVIRPCRPNPYELDDNANVTYDEHLSIGPFYGGCIPSPLPPMSSSVPQKPKSEAENFIERLWAFLTIENLLDENYIGEEEGDGVIPEYGGELTNNENEEKEYDDEVTNNTNEEKALELALKYNFVTKLTSLYVIKPDDEQTNGTDDFSGTVVNPEPTSVRDSEVDHSLVNSYAAPPSHSSSPSPIFYDYSLDYSLRSGMVSDMDFSNSMMSIPSYGHAASYDFYSDMIYDVYSDEDDDKIEAHHEYGFNDMIISHHTDPTPTTSTNTTDPQCSLIMFDQTYLRGEEVTFSKLNNSNVIDLSQFSFDNKIASLKVIGTCCWKIFEHPNFTGQNKIFSEGEYKSVVDLGSALIKEASSVKIAAC